MTNPIYDVIRDLIADIRFSRKKIKSGKYDILNIKSELEYEQRCIGELRYALIVRRLGQKALDRWGWLKAQESAMKIYKEQRKGESK